MVTTAIGWRIRCGQKFALRHAPTAPSTGILRQRNRTHRALESHDDAFPFRESRDAWNPRNCDPRYLPARSNIRPAGGWAARAEPRVTLGRRYGAAAVESAPSGRPVLRDVPQRTTQDSGPEARPDRRRQPQR